MKTVIYEVQGAYGGELWSIWFSRACKKAANEKLKELKSYYPFRHFRIIKRTEEVIYPRERKSK